MDKHTIINYYYNNLSIPSGPTKASIHYLVGAKVEN